MKVPELKEIFDIFIVKLDENKQIMDANQKMFEATQHLAEEKNSILSAIDKKASQIANYRPNITYSVPELETLRLTKRSFCKATKTKSIVLSNPISEL